MDPAALDDLEGIGPVAAWPTATGWTRRQGRSDYTTCAKRRHPANLKYESEERLSLIKSGRHIWVQPGSKSALRSGNPWA